MRTPKEIKRDILQQRQEAEPMLRSQFSFCVGGNMLTHSVTPEEYKAIIGDVCDGRVIFGYYLVIQ